MQTSKLIPSNSESAYSLNQTLSFVFVACALTLAGCSSLPKVNEVEQGMNRKQVIQTMGSEPYKKDIINGHELMYYKLGSGDEAKLHMIMLKNNEVIGSGSPEQVLASINAENEKSDDTPTNNTVSPTITASPTINVNPVIQMPPQQYVQPRAVYDVETPAQQPTQQVNPMMALQAMQGFYNLQNQATTFQPGAPMRPQIMAPQRGGPINPYDPANY